MTFALNRSDPGSQWSSADTRCSTGRGFRELTHMEASSDWTRGSSYRFSAAAPRHSTRFAACRWCQGAWLNEQRLSLPMPKLCGLLQNWSSGRSGGLTLSW